MLAQALAAYADTYLSDQLADFAFEQKPVPLVLSISSNGAFLGLRETAETVIEKRGGMEKAVLRIPSMLVPRSPISRNSVVAPLVGVDSIQYVVGPGPWTTPPKEANHQHRFAAFVELLGKVAIETADTAVVACTLFYEDQAAVAAAREALAAKKAKDGALVALAVRIERGGLLGPAELLPARPAVRDWWRRHYQVTTETRRQDAALATCLISGRLSQVAMTHEKIKGAASLGGQPSGVALMSFDKPAFRSYGWEQNENAPVSTDRANAYVLALNDLLRPGKHRLGSSPDVLLSTRFDLNDTAFLYWTDAPVDEDPMGTILSPEDIEQQAIDASEAAAVARGVYHAPLAGRPAPARDTVRFCLLAVSANGARLVVRRWMSRSLAEVRGATEQWFRDLTIADVFDGGQPSQRPRLIDVVRTLVPDRGTKTLDQLRGAEIAILLARALGDGRLGLRMLAAVIVQQRHAEGSRRLAPERAGFIRLLTNECAATSHERGPHMPAALDEEIDHPAYLCGRLFAELENLQRVANDGEVNATIADRYYSAASTNPQLILPRVLDLSNAHLKKLRRDKAKGSAYGAIRRRVDELVERAGGRAGVFPGALSLIDQGRFAIGYHHQRAEGARAARAAKEEKERSQLTGAAS